MSLIMPKGDGTLKALKASLNVYFDYKNTWLNNEDFKIEIAEEMELGEGRNASFLIKKSEIARYFGLIEYDFRYKEGRITQRGLDYLASGSKEGKLDIIFESILSDSFGRNNDASRSGDSDLDPPKLLLKAILELGKISKKEFARLLYLIADLNFHFEDVILDFYESNVELPDDLENKYNDIKFLVFLENLGLIEKEDKYYYLNESFFDEDEILKIVDMSIYNTDDLEYSKIIKSTAQDNDVIKIYNDELLDVLNNRDPEVVDVNSSKKYKTNPRIKKTAIANVNYECQFDHRHHTFNDTRGNRYMEGHHLIPMNAQSDFEDDNLDRIENIISLCPTCHRAVHYGSNDVKKEILRNLYDEQIKELHKVDLYISFEELFSYY